MNVVYHSLSIPGGVVRHSDNVARANACHSASEIKEAVRVNEGKNPHAVALGRMTSEAKARAAQENGKEGGRPKGS